MKKISTITFHASYNYGSNLQSFALQEFVKKIGNNKYDYEIINFRTKFQKELYKCIFEQTGIKKYIKRILYFKDKKELYKKQELFENFINKRLNITKEYSTLEELKNEKWDSDYYVAGSDQLWNLMALDFDWANYLEFVESDKKISYAASFGPKPQVWNEEEKERVKKNLMKFKYLSVREEGSFNNVKELTGKDAEIHVDPTMLLTKEEWEKHIPQERLYKGKYIFLYNLKSSEYVKLAHRISKELKLPVLISKEGRLEEVFYGFKRKFDVGPLEFLNLIKYSELTLSSSFHGTIFSILLNKPFFALKGKKDFRIQTLLEKMNLGDRSIDFDDYKEKCEKAFDIDFSETYKLLDEEREKSKKYLMKALDIKE